MKINGKEFTTKHVQTVVLPRNGENIVFKLGAVTDYKEFEALCPAPMPPVIQRPNQPSARDITNPKYQLQISEWSQKRTAWAMIQSLKETEGLTWDKVVEGDPSTWSLWVEELKAANFHENEIARIMRAYMQANCLDETFLEEARKSFFREESARLAALSSPTVEQPSTQSGPPANA